MPARVPLDVDLEDRLLYGLTPTRLIYLVVGLLAAFSLWSGRWAPLPFRASIALVIAGVAAAAAWGRWRGRPLDGWAADIAAYVAATYRIQLQRPRLPKWRWRR